MTTIAKQTQVSVDFVLDPSELRRAEKQNIAGASYWHGGGFRVRAIKTYSVDGVDAGVSVQFACVPVSGMGKIIPHIVVVPDFGVVSGSWLVEQAGVALGVLGLMSDPSVVAEHD